MIKGTSFKSAQIIVPFIAIINPAKRTVIFLEVTQDNDSRITGVWLTNAEKQKPSVRQELKMLCQQNKERKYKTAVFLSGNRDLMDCTQSLLLHNRYPKVRDQSR